MNRITLALNAAILVVTFVVALTASDVHGSLLASATRTAGQGYRSSGTRDDASAALLRVVQTMDSYYPASPSNPLTRAQLEAIRDAIHAYRAGVRLGLGELLTNAGESDDLRLASNQLGRSLRVDLESILAKSFKDHATVTRLATEVVRQAR